MTSVRTDGRGERTELEAAPIAVVDIGNTSVATGLWLNGAVSKRARFDHDSTGAIGDGLASLSCGCRDGLLGGVVIASVVPDLLCELSELVERRLNVAPLIVGRQVPLPLELKLSDPTTVGVDRVCVAAGAFHLKKQACVVVAFGTAITVNVVDDEGAFVGGAILPGLDMQARALHEFTASLPRVGIHCPSKIVGDDTESAIVSGIVHGTGGAVRGVVEAFASEFGTWPAAMATGGDAEMMASHYCEIFDAVVPDLCLTGVGLAFDLSLKNAVRL